MTSNRSNSTESQNTVLLISNRRLDENAGRAEKFATRSRLLEERGWNLQVGYVNPTMAGVLTGIARCIKLGQEADVINSVSNPPHTQIAGAVTARVTGAPWLAEFRDPLVKNPDVDPNSKAVKARKLIERYILNKADRVAWYDGIQIPDDYFASKYPDVPAERYIQLPPIGFEEEKFDKAKPEQYERFTITYAGSFYEGWIEPYTFLEGLGRYIGGEIGNSDVQAVFYGDWNNSYERAASREGVGDHIDSRSFVPHEEIVSVLKGSDILLYIGGNNPKNRLNLPSKLYDYIGAKRPILAIVDPSFRVAEVIRDEGLGIVVEPGDPQGVARAIHRIRSHEFEYSPNEETLDQFTRSQSTDAYIEILEQLKR